MPSWACCSANRLARRYAGTVAAALAAALLWLASPLVFYSVIAMPWSHAPGLFAFALFLTIWLGSDERHWWHGWHKVRCLSGHCWG
ncbi:MAG: hypothetical protein HC893_11885 [Chloroflexaceae bacterium]|nr:hypothetical protein [Chloroflexaceae bacterium]